MEPKMSVAQLTQLDSQLKREVEEDIADLKKRISALEEFKEEIDEIIRRRLVGCGLIDGAAEDE